MEGATARRFSADTAPAVDAAFSYEEAFSRNLGWLTEYEQQALRFKRVAIAGLGGVGGVHLLTLARFGIGAFNIADPDHFELANFNRQVGATLDTIGRSKVAVLAESTRKINPDIRITGFEHGLNESNLDAFLSGVDLCIDAIDFFVLNIRGKLTDRCQALGIPVINAAPLGMGTAFLVFMAGSMSFEEWFRLEGLSPEHQYVNYLLGMAPASLHRSYLADPTRVDLARRHGPSTPAACELCAGVAAVTALKLLLGRGTVKSVPYYHHFDPYRDRFVVRKLRGGNRNLRQRLKIAVTRRLAAHLSRQATTTDPTPETKTDIEKILDLARWAPSGDNCQPWRFEIIGEDRVVIDLTRQSDDLYDYRDGEPTLLSGGMLLESMRIAASYWGRRCEWAYQGREGDVFRVSVALPRMPGVVADPLLSYIPMRSVDRRPYRRKNLSNAEKSALTAALGPKLALEWHETLRERWRLARLGAKATAVRLTTPEAFPVHRRALDWGRQFSPDRIPAAAAGMSRASLWPMRWAMQGWTRMQLLNWLGGVWAAAIQMDYIPGLFSAAFFTVHMTAAEAGSDADRVIGLLEAGRSIQRFWLTATRLGLAIQPAMATLIFADYGERGEPFTRKARAQYRAEALADALRCVLPDSKQRLTFLGRIGRPTPQHKFHRSTRHRLADLLIADQQKAR